MDFNLQGTSEQRREKCIKHFGTSMSFMFMCKKFVIDWKQLTVSLESMSKFLLV